MGGEYLLITTLDWLIDVLLPAIFVKLDSWYLYTGVTVLGFIGALFVVWFVYRRFV